MNHPTDKGSDQPRRRDDTEDAPVIALVLAGGDRAQTLLAGRPMLDYVVDALQNGLPSASRVLVASDVQVPPGCERVPGGASLVDTLMNGVAALQVGETRLLVVTADIPFLTGEAVADFVCQAANIPAEFHYAIVPAGLCEARFPAMRRTTLRVGEGRFTGGNIALLDPSFLRAREGLLRQAYARRKSVTALAKLLGPGLVVRLLASRVSSRFLVLAHLEDQVSRALGGVRARAVVSRFPEIGADLDRPEDIEMACQLLERITGQK